MVMNISFINSGVLCHCLLILIYNIQHRRFGSAKSSSPLVDNYWVNVVCLVGCMNKTEGEWEMKEKKEKKSLGNCHYSKN